MKRICAWCKIEMDSTHLECHSVDTITHGICEECKEDLLGGQKAELTPFPGSLNMPIVVFDAMVNTETA